MRGGEIFVPKIPSMLTVDLARTVAPALPHKIVGIRPGEKLHEVMVPRDDSRTTVELSDRYVIVPASSPQLMDFYLKSGGARVAEDFEYASNLNPEHLDARGLQSLLADQFN
jgi:UDP-N-acetylglucosamine 4,6-dehydratase